MKIEGYPGSLVGRKFQLQYGKCEVIEVEGGTVFLKNINDERDVRRAALPMFEMGLKTGLVKEL